MLLQPEVVTDRDPRRVRARRSRLVWAGAALMVVGVALLAVVLIGGLRSSDVSTRPSPTPTTSGEPSPSSPSSTSEEPEPPAPSPTRDETEGSPPEASPSSTDGDEDSPSSPPQPSAPVTVTVTATQTLLTGSGGGTTAGKSGLDVPSTITAVAGLITAGVGAASFLAGKKRNPPPAGDSAAR